jgi:hypothetical protein
MPQINVKLKIHAHKPSNCKTKPLISKYSLKNIP